MNFPEPSYPQSTWAHIAGGMHSLLPGSPSTCLVIPPAAVTGSGEVFGWQKVIQLWKLQQQPPSALNSSALPYAGCSVLQPNF